MTSLIQVAVSKENAENLISRIMRYVLVKSFHFQNINSYLLFLIIHTPRWRDSYVQKVADYDKLIEDCNKYLTVILRAQGQIGLPSNIFKSASELPEVSDIEVGEAIKGMSQKVEELMNLDADEMIIAEILNKSLINRDKFWDQAFEHCSKKKVIRKWLKGKEIKFPESLDEYQKWEGELPKELVSYISTTTFRLKKAQYKKSRKVKLIDIDELRHNPTEDELSIYNYYELLENESFMEKLTLRAEELLTKRKRDIIHLKYEANLNQEEIAKKLQISQPMVSKHASKALAKLRKISKSILYSKS